MVVISIGAVLAPQQRVVGQAVLSSCGERRGCHVGSPARLWCRGDKFRIIFNDIHRLSLDSSLGSGLAGGAGGQPWLIFCSSGCWLRSRLGLSAAGLLGFGSLRRGKAGLSCICSGVHSWLREGSKQVCLLLDCWRHHRLSCWWLGSCRPCPGFALPLGLACLWRHDACLSSVCCRLSTGLGEGRMILLSTWGCSCQRVGGQLWSSSCLCLDFALPFGRRCTLWHHPGDCGGFCSWHSSR